MDLLVQRSQLPADAFRPKDILGTRRCTQKQTLARAGIVLPLASHGKSLQDDPSILTAFYSRHKPILIRNYSSALRHLFIGSALRIDFS